MVNGKMRAVLERAVQERATKRLGKPLNDHQFEIVMNASMNMQERGFDRETVWRALELATEQP